MSVDLECLVFIVLKYADHNKYSYGYISFLIIICEIHKYKRSLNIRGNGYNDCIMAMHHYSPTVVT